MGLAIVGAVAWRFRRAESRAASLTNLPAPAGEAPVEIHGHRGARGLLPENTLPAFEHALALGVDAMELDVGMTRDGVPVVHHDRRLDPDHTRDRSGAWLAPPGPLLRGLDLEALAAFDVGRAAPGGETAKRFPRQMPCDGARVPLLREVLALAQRSGGRRFYFNIEVKLTVEGLAEAHRLGLKVVVWTVNDVHDMAALARMGVDGIITDYPDRAIEALKPPVAGLAGGRGEDAGPPAWPGSRPYRA